eukprot:7297173-Karenia_brevis.AAC.1
MAPSSGLVRPTTSPKINSEQHAVHGLASFRMAIMKFSVQRIRLPRTWESASKPTPSRLRSGKGIGLGNGSAMADNGGS